MIVENPQSVAGRALDNIGCRLEHSAARKAEPSAFARENASLSGNRLTFPTGRYR